MQIVFDLIPPQMRIAVVIQQTLLRGQESAFSVYVDRSAFEYNSGLNQRPIQNSRDVLRHRIIAIPRRVFLTPGVKNPIGYHEIPVFIFYKDRTMITRPGCVCRDSEEANVVQRNIRFLQQLAH